MEDRKRTGVRVILFLLALAGLASALAAWRSRKLAANEAAGFDAHRPTAK